MDGPSSEIDPEELDASEAAVKRRIAERARRADIRQSLERMTLLFALPGPDYLWSRPQTLFYGESIIKLETDRPLTMIILAITYLVYGAGAFGDGSGFFTPKPQL